VPITPLRIAIGAVRAADVTSSEMWAAASSFESDVSTEYQCVGRNDIYSL
jgi:hypothetical protein